MFSVNVSQCLKIMKVKPVIEAVRERCRELPLEEYNITDTANDTIYRHIAIKAFIKDKPNPVGFKSFLICGKSIYAHDFELFQGNGTGVSPEHKSFSRFSCDVAF